MTAQPLKIIVLNLLQQGHLDEEAFVQELNETERTAIGMWKRWSAKDHLAHRTFWRQDLILKVTAILQHQEVPPSEEREDQLNSKVFEKHKLRPWSALHAESERVYAELLKVTEQLSEEDLTDSHRFAYRRKAAVYSLPGQLLRFHDHVPLRLRVLLRASSAVCLQPPLEQADRFKSGFPGAYLP